MAKYLQVLFLVANLLPVLAAATETDAPSVPVPSLKFDGSLRKIDQKVAKLFGEETQKTLRQVAEAAVLSDYCAAINLDQVKFKQAFQTLAVEGGKRAPDEQRTYENKLSMYFGVYVGLLVAEGADRRAEFCGLAENALKEQRPISRFWIATSAGSKPPQP